MGTQSLTTVTARQALFPAASHARTVITLVPTSNGIRADQAAEPEACPEEPVEADQVTAVTPTLSAALPEIVIEADEVETIVEPGDTIRSVGAAWSVPPAGFEGGGTGAVGGCDGVGVDTAAP